MRDAPGFPTSAIVRAPEALILGGGRLRRIDIPVRYGLWRRPDGKTVLIDTGYGPVFAGKASKSLALSLYRHLLRIDIDMANTVQAQLTACGIAADDISEVIVTHFHADHISELGAFANARFIASGAAYAKLAAMSRRQQLAEGYFAELMPADFVDRLTPVEELGGMAGPFGLGECRDLFGDGCCLAVPLPGHALGHFGLVWPHFNTPLLYAVDVQWCWQAIAQDRLPGFPTSLVFHNRTEIAQSVEKVRRFAAHGGRIVLTHDPRYDPDAHETKA